MRKNKNTKLITTKEKVSQRDDKVAKIKQLKSKDIKLFSNYWYETYIEELSKSDYRGLKIKLPKNTNWNSPISLQGSGKGDVAWWEVAYDKKYCGKRNENIGHDKGVEYG